MTANQITKALLKAGINLDGVEIRNREIEICIGYEEVNGRGSSDDEANHEKHVEIAKVLPAFAVSTSTQYGALMLYEGRELCTQDYFDTSHPAHY